MASRSGKTVSGTDGTDHQFREKVASQYKESAKLKRNLRFIYAVLIIPILILLVHVLRINDKIKFTNQVLPTPEKWEYLYVSSAIINLIGYSSLARNATSRMSMYIYGISVTAFGAIIWAAVSHVMEVEAFIMRGRVKSYLFGRPLVITIYIFLAVVMQMNIYALNHARNLMKAWKAKGYKSS